jgi:hypothetical protein
MKWRPSSTASQPPTKFDLGSKSKMDKLVAAGVVLRRHENQPRARRCLPLLRCAAKGLEDADDRKVGRDDTDSDGYDDGHTENERHEERDQDQPPCQKFEIRCRNPSLRIATKRGYLNLPGSPPAASDHPDAPELQAL